MTYDEVISAIDKVRPNTAAIPAKRAWITVLESKIHDHMTSFSECDVNVSHDSLLLGEEYLDMYVYYAVSMIDLENQDIAMYNNSCAFFNEMFESWQKKWRRENLPIARRKGGA